MISSCRVCLLWLSLAGALQAAPATWAATHVGPHKSTDGGATWQQVKVTVSSSLLQGAPNVGAIAVDPLNPLNVYFIGAVTGTSAFFKSGDGGQTWSAVLISGLQVGTNQNSTYWLTIDPVVTSTMYIAANKTWRSTDSGATWAPMGPLDTLGGLTGIVGLAVDPKNSGVVYASGTHGLVVKSADFGATWKTLVTLQPNSSPTTAGIYVDPRDTKRLYVSHTFGQGCFSANRVSADCGLFRSLDAGVTWEIVPIPGVVRSVDFDRVTGDIYAGGNETGVGSVVLKSTDQGTTWTPLAKGMGGINNGPAVSVDPGTTGVVYSLGDSSGGGGLLQRSTDAGATWKKVTMPQYCPSASCPAGLGTVTPQVYSFAYEAPPPPPAVSVTSTVSAASLQGGAVAPESIVIATGAHLATADAVADLLQPPLTLAGTSVNVTDSAGVTRPAALFKVSATQIVYQVPAGTAAGAATVTVTAGDGISGSAQVQVAPVAPGLYTLNAGGLVKAYAVRVSNGNLFVEDVYETDGTGAVIPRAIPVSNGDQVTLVIYGTGFRAAGGDVGATIGGVIAPVLYAGPQGLQPGMDQFNVMIPPELGTGTPQPVQIVFTAGGQTANAVTITVQ